MSYSDNVKINAVAVEEDEESSCFSISSFSSTTSSGTENNCSSHTELTDEDDTPCYSNNILNNDIFTFRSNVVPRMLYEQANITLDEAVSNILEIWVKHNLTKATLKSQLKLISNMLPKNNILPKSVYKFFNYVEEQAPPCALIKHFFCRKCLIYISENCTDNGMIIYISFITEKYFFPSKTDCCVECGDSDISNFFELDFIDQLKRILETTDVCNLFKNTQISSCICDITSGTEYQRVNLGRQKYDLTLVMYTDGISLSKSTKTHCWPLMITIAELPPDVRNNYIITAGLWFDKDIKPEMNLFLQPFCIKIKKCLTDGIQWIEPFSKDNVTSIIRAPLFIADAPARAQILNMLHFNGQFGCNICEISTKPCRPLTGKRTVRIYPYKKNLTLRKGSVMKKQAEKVENSNDLKHVKGVKGCTILSCLPLLDIGTCVIPEYMHSVLLGVVKQFLRIWFCKKGPWKLKKKVLNINKYLMNIKPLQSFARKPRSILEFKSYKATELYYWLMFYSTPTLKKFLPDIYFQHWILLVISLFNLLQQRIKPKDIEKSNDLLHKFVKQVKVIYGEREMSYNIHQLLHLSLCVERWGPLWANSAFAFESHNGVLAKSLHGTHHMGQEIMNNLKIYEGSKVIRNRLKTNCQKSSQNEGVIRFELMGNTVRYNAHFDLLILNGLDNEIIKFYSRIKINQDIFTSKFYKVTKTNNFTVDIILEDNTCFYGEIEIFLVASNQIYTIVKCFEINQQNTFTHEETGAIIKHIIPILDTNNNKLINLKEIKYISHLIRVGKYVCKKPNLFKSVF